MRSFISVLILFGGSISFAGQSCRTVGFSMRDGMAIPVVECTGLQNDLSIVEKFGGGSSSYWGMKAGSGRVKQQGMDSYENSLPEGGNNSSLFKPPTVHNLPSSKQPVIDQKAVEKMQKDFNAAMKNHAANLEMIGNLHKQAYNANMAQQSATEKQLAGIAAGLAMQQHLIQKNIFDPMRAQIKFEKQFMQSINETYVEAEIKLLDSMQGDLLEIFSADDISIQSDVRGQQFDSKLSEISKQIKDRERKQIGSEGRLSYTVDAASGLINSGDVDQRNHAIAATALALASSNASADGKEEIANSYSTAAATAIDIALGFVPIAGSMNDLTQIAFGLATGRDYTGAEMTGIDYGIRAFGVVVGIVPVAYLGGVAITEGFLRGAELIRSSPGIVSLVSDLRTFGQKFGVIVEVAGSLIPSGLRDVAEVAKLRTQLPNLFAHSKDIIQRLPEEQVSTVFKALTDNTIDVRDRWAVLTSFEVGTVNVRSILKGESVYRWSSHGEMGRYFTQELITDSLKARELLALPPMNEMRVLKEYRLTSDTLGITGRVARNFGHEGGGTQLFLKSNSLELVRIVK